MTAPKASQQAKQMAYEAGEHAFQAHMTPDGCPFDPGTAERSEWLRGFGDKLDAAPDPAALKAALKEAR